MENKIFLKNGQKVHFIGIGGVSMSGLATHLKSKGFSVSGSDICAKNLSLLQKQGINVYNKHSQENIKNVNAIVYTSAIKCDNVELKEAKNKGLKLIKRSELLGQILENFDVSIAISGSHGKTTATDMLSNVLIEADLDPTVFLGGLDKNFGNYRLGNNQMVIAEACEYERNFLDLNPKICVVLNVDNDHLDTYKNIDEEVKAFKQFVNKGICVINADDKNYAKLCTKQSISFSIEQQADFMAKEIYLNKNGYSFNAYHKKEKLGTINLNIAGKHNIYNALSAIAVSHYLNIPFKYQKIALEKFSGVKRRNEFLGKFENLDIYADYAHHPKEISEMLKTFLEQRERYITIFQPHTYSRTSLLMKEFLECFKGVEPLIIYKTFPARESYSKAGSGKSLYNKLKVEEDSKVYYAGTKKQLVSLLKELSVDYSKAVFLGAGDIYELAQSIVKNNSKSIDKI